MQQIEDPDPDDKLVDLVMNEVRENVVPEPDGKQNVQSNVWYAKGHITPAEATDFHGYQKQEVVEAIAQLRYRGEIFYWHGLLTLREDEYMKAIIENERQSDAPRQVLIGKANEVLHA